MKRFASYLEGRPRLVLEYPLQEPCSFFDVLVDTDHAGCLRTRKSTNGGALMFGLHAIKTWSSTQS
eukprot:7780073-Pyramimonas_sp.AAC.1